MRFKHELHPDIRSDAVCLVDDEGGARHFNLAGVDRTRLYLGVVVEVFRKLPEVEIDDTVFDAVADLLGLPGRGVQVAALELLKFGRLKRALPQGLVDAVGGLAAHDDLRIRRRALVALAAMPRGKVVPWFERAVTAKMRRLTDQYGVRIQSNETARARLWPDRTPLRTQFIQHRQDYDS